MHEFALARSIVETALAETKKHNASSIGVLNVKLSKISHITPENLEFCLKAAAEGTMVEKAQLKIEVFSPRARCRECGYVFQYQESEPVCPRCQSRKLEMVDAGEAFLESIEVE